MRQVNPDKELYKRLIIRFVITIISIWIIILLLPKLFRFFHPFIFALIIATILNPIVGKIHDRVSKMDNRSLGVRKVITLVLNLIIISIILYLIFFISYTIIMEIISFSFSIQQNWGNIVNKLDNLQENFSWITNRFPPQLIELLDGFKDNILDMIKNTSKQLISSSISVTASIITGAGNLFINFLTFFLSMYFLISDYHIIGDMADKYSHRSIVKTFSIIKSSLKLALGGFVRSQLILAGFAFTFMFIGFKLYGLAHAFIIALFLGFVDLLPFLGTIAVLLPWGIVEYISGDIKKGLFLILLGASYTLIRRIIEPKVMGSQTGLHPLLALMSTYVGLKISGLWGAILGPLVLTIFVSIAKSGIFANTVSDLKKVYTRISRLLKGPFY